MDDQATTGTHVRRTQQSAPVYTRMSWRHSYWIIALIAASIGVLSIVVNLAFDWAVHGIVRHIFPSDILDSPVATVLSGFVLIRMQSHRRQLLIRMQIIEDVNHHVRNALESITLSSTLRQDQELDAKVRDAYDRIDWVLSDVLPQTVNGRGGKATNGRWHAGRRLRFGRFRNRGTEVRFLR
ncbi:MAG: hypothetical protein ABI076_12140 [Acidobacteriaceae bacterium]